MADPSPTDPAATTSHIVPADPANDSPPPTKLDQRQQSCAHWIGQHFRSRKVRVSIFGTTSILAGIVMLITPGPGIITILMGLMALGTEFAWARWLVSWAPKILRDLAKKALDLSLGELDSPKATPPSPASSPSAGPPITTAAEPSASEVDTISVSDTALPGSSNPVDPPRAVTDAL